MQRNCSTSHERRRQRWLSNLSLLGDFAGDQCDFAHATTTEDSLIAGARLHLHSLRFDIVVLNQPPDRVLWALCLLRLVWRFQKPRLVLLDVIFRKPRPGLAEQLKRVARSVLYAQVDLFLMFMKDFSVLRTHYSIPPERCQFIPFKANRVARSFPVSNLGVGTYVHMGGASRRDFKTFCEAMAMAKYPGVIVTPPTGLAQFHETYLDESWIPPNVKLVRHDGNPDSWVSWIAGARIVVICVTADSITPSGVSTYLEAMYLRRCVIMSEGLATRGVLHNGEEAAIVPRGDPVALAEAIQRYWDDEPGRLAMAERGHRYAASLGGEVELVERVCETVMRFERD